MEKRAFDFGHNDRSLEKKITDRWGDGASILSHPAFHFELDTLWLNLDFIHALEEDAAETEHLH